MKQNKNFQGFTLIEVVIVVAIILIMTAVLLASLVDNKDDRELSVAMREVASGLRQAQNYALTGKILDGLRPCQYSFVTAGNTYRLQVEGYDPTVVGNSCSNGTVTFNDPTITVSKGIAISPKSLLFAVPSGRITALSSPTTFPQAITLNKGGTAYLICIHASGRIEERNKEVSCS